MQNDLISEHPGVDRTNKHNQPKLLKRVVSLIFDRVFLSNITWSGKSVRGQKKIAMKKFHRVVDLMYTVSNKIFGNYEYNTFLDHLKNKILKYAYEQTDQKASQAEVNRGTSSLSTISDRCQPEQYSTSAGRGRPDIDYWNTATYTYM